MRVLKKLGSDRGYSNVEMLFVLVILCLFAITSYVLVAVGAGRYSAIMDSRDNGGNARVAMSYIVMRLRQNDADAQISLRDTGSGELCSSGENSSAALYMTEQTDYGSSYDTIIYFSEGALYETYQESSMPFDPASGELICDLSGVGFSVDGGLLSVSVSCGDSSLSTSIAPRCGVNGGVAAG